MEELVEWLLVVTLVNVFFSTVRTANCRVVYDARLSLISITAQQSNSFHQNLFSHTALANKISTTQLSSGFQQYLYQLNVSYNSPKLFN